MKTEDFNRALNHIDADIVEEYLKEKELAEIRSKRRKTTRRLVPLVACLMVMVIALPIVGGLMNSTGSALSLNSFFEGNFFPMEYRYVYSFVFYDVTYSAKFMDIRQGIEEKYVGDHLGEVLATDKNGKQTVCKIYDYYYDAQSMASSNRRAMNTVYELYANYAEILIRGANYKEIIIEIEGSYFPAIISPVMVNEK